MSINVEPVLKSADPLIRLALDEDLGAQGDITSQALVPWEQSAKVNIVSREAGVLCGVILIPQIYSALTQRLGKPDVQVDVRQFVSDGDVIEPGTVVASVTGPVQLLLSGERVVLNFLIHLSGIASRTATFVKKAGDTGVAILDTRKTLPGYRLLHKYAVRCGGGTNHRIGLFDGMLIKDNHLAAQPTPSVADAVSVARDYLHRQSLDLPVEVEVDSLEQLRNALQQRPEIVLLDNMKPTELKQAVTIRNELSPQTLLEASGGVSLETIGCIAASGVDRISIGAVTHSAPALDLGYDWP